MPRLLSCFVALLLPATGGAAEPVAFARDILPILSDTCFACHGPDEAGRKGSLRLDLQSAAYGSGKSGAVAIVPGQPEASEVIVRIFSRDRDEVMPPPKALRQLTESQKERLRRWVAEGAVWGRHWAYEPPVRPALPTFSDEGLSHPIDAFVAARLKPEGLSLTPEAPTDVLVRRLSLDLTGLPPVAHGFQPGTAVDLERVIDRLLASPAFGERWAWDWLDAARYADTNGYQGDPERTMWPWRDWVVDAINANMPYDRFTIEQLAGDLLPGASHSQQLASGFHRNHMHNGEGGRIAEETRVENVFDRVETTATIWLAATFNCCRCHDHKYDPLAQRDYFALYDIFNQMSETGAGRGGQAPPVLDFSTAAETTRVELARTRLTEVAAEVDAFEKRKFPRPEGVPLNESAAARLPGNLPATLAAREPAKRGVDAILEAMGYFETDGADPAYVDVLRKLLAAVRARDAAQAAVTRVMIMDQLREPRDTFILDKGAYDKPTPVQVTGAMPVALLGNSTPPASRASRLDLARWLVDRGNPLTARVTVNRFWQALFGTGLVKSAEDFGLQGEKPSHPELLDWLAVEFMDSGWDVKRLLRLIVISRTYRQSSRVTSALAERDPENRLLARGPRHRLPSWMLRDLALAAAGLLSPAQGGPAVKPYQPEGIWEEATFGKKSYVQDHGESLYRRTLYTYWRRIVGPTVLFDNAARQVCEVKLKRTNTPLHALTTLNETGYVEAARVLAQRVLQSGSTDRERLRELFHRVLFRSPSVVEADILQQRLDRLRTQYRADPGAVLELLAVGEFPRDPKLDVVDHAAFTALAQLVLNLDEALGKE